MKLLKILFFNFLIFFLLLILLESFFGYWFKDENFGIYMRKERKLNWKTISNFNNKNYSFLYKRNHWGFRGEEFDPKNVKIIFEGGSTGNQRFTPDDLTIVGVLNEKFKNSDTNYKIYNASTDGKSLNGYINDFINWFPKIPNLNPEIVIFYIGINDRSLNINFYLDNKISEKKIDKIKDYVKNNSVIYDKFKIVKNKYFPKNTFAYDFENNLLYANFEYIDFKEAQHLHKNLKKENLILAQMFNKKLLNLKKILNKEKIKPIFITQVMFNGLKDERLFVINNELKKFSLKNNYPIISLDEIIEMKKNDFYDTVHTTPQGSKKIADKIFPYLYEYINKF